MTNIDFKKELKSLFNPSAKKVETVDVPLMNFLMIDGSGDPNKATEYKNAVEALFTVSYALKFMVKKEKEVDYGVLPLEGLAVQIMHIGPYSAEGPTIQKLHNFIKENGYEIKGKHHEIYLTNPRRSAPERMKKS